MFRIEIEADSFDELEARLEAALDRIRGNATARGAASATAGSSRSTTTEAGSGSASSAKDKPSASDTDALVYENDVRPHVVKLSKDHGREAALEVLNQFETEEGEPCTKGQEVQEKDWASLLKKVKARHKKLDAEKAAADD